MAHDLDDAEQPTALEAVPDLKAGRTEARESEPVKPVSDAMIHTALEHLTPILRAMVRVQGLTGMRPGELCSLTTGMIDTSSEVWTATFQQHKTAYTGAVAWCSSGRVLSRNSHLG